MRSIMEYLALDLSDYCLTFHLGNEDNASVYQLQNIVSPFDCSKRICYFASLTDLHKDTLPKVPVNWIIQTDTNEVLPPELSHALRFSNYLLVNSSLTSEAAAVHLDMVVAKMERFHTFTEEITEAHYQGRGLQAISDLGSRMLDAPVAILDPAYVLLAWSGIDSTDNPYYNATKENGYIHEDAVELIKKTHRFAKAQADENVSHTPNTFSEISTTPYGWLDVSIRINNMIVAYLSVSGETHPFSEFDKDCLSHLAKVASLELQKNEFFIQNHGIIYETFMYDLLDQRMKNDDAIHSRMRLLNIRFKKYYYIIAIHHRKKTGTKAIPSGTQTLFRNLFRGSISAPYKKGIVLLLSSDDWNMNLPKEKNELTALLDSHNLYMGISNSFQDLSLTGEYYLQAYQAIEYGYRINAKEGWYFYRDYSIYHAIDLYAQNYNLINLFHPAVRQLYLSQKKSDKELLETLESYIRNMKNVTQITEELHIHKSTLFYRIGKIRSMTKSEFSEGDEWLQLSLSINILHYLNALNNTD